MKTLKQMLTSALFPTALLLCMYSCNGGEEIPDAVRPQKPAEEEEKEIPAHDFLMGSLFGFEKDVRNGKASASGGTSTTTFYNRPLFEMYEFRDATSDQDWWDNLVEEYLYAGLDYMIPNCRGCLPRADRYTDHGDPAHIQKLLNALEDRGAKDMKIAIFDDAPASWAAALNFDQNGRYAFDMAAGDRYPIDDILDDEEAFQNIYKYIWDYNIKLAFDNFYGENQKYNDYLLRIDGKPLLFVWSPNGFVNYEYDGVKPVCTKRFKKIFDRIHEDFRERYGEELHICADKAFQDRDPYVTGKVVESMNDWFVAAQNVSKSYTLRSVNKYNVGVACPGFWINDKKGDKSMFFDANHGKRLSEALDYFITYKASFVMLEGFTDMYENAAYFRSTDSVFYDYPNQRLNILRKYSSRNAYPEHMNVEAESCDRYLDRSKGNSGRQYRSGDLDVSRAEDTYRSWCVCDTEAGEWLEWVELPYSAGTSEINLRYRSSFEAVIRFAVDGKDCVEKTLPSTGGQWKTVTAASVKFDKKGWYKTVLKVVSGSPDFNWFSIDRQ